MTANGAPEHRQPRDCPVCGDRLAVTRLGCPGCGSEISGVFNACPFCALGEQDRRLLEVFLVSRGNTKEIERFLGVSYPTARQRVTEMLARLGLEKESPSADKHEILSRLAAGDIDVDEAAELLGEAR